jgi:hypothetical protein
MDRIVVISRVGGNGILELTVPVGPADANRDVRVTVEPAGTPSPDEWRRGILETAGRWQGDIERPEQGDYEQRTP